MTATEPKKRPNKETWREWLPPGAPEPLPEDLVTRDDILAKLARSNVPTNEREFRYLQTLGVLPRPTFRRIGNATVGVYPRWVYNAALSALHLRGEGMSWDYIRERIRGNPTHFHFMAGLPSDPPVAIARAIEELAAWHKQLTGQTVARAEVRLFNERGHRLGGVDLDASRDDSDKLEVSNTIFRAKENMVLAEHPQDDESTKATMGHS